MTDPGGGWLSIVDVKDQLRIDGIDTDDDLLINRAIGSAMVEVERARRDQFVPADPPTDPPSAVYSPDAEVYQGAVMLAARLVRRRNSPAGIETFSDSVAYVSRWDPDIQRALRQGNYAWPALG
jgi:hypothetical protein